MRLAELLEKEGDELLATWAEQARALPHGSELPGLVLLDDVPSLLVALAEHLEDKGSAELVARRGLEHAGQRRREGVPLRSLVAEYGLLRRTILTRYLELEPVPEDIVRMDEVIDEAITTMTERFVDERRRLLEEEMSRTNFAVAAAQLGTWDYVPPRRQLTWDARSKELFGLDPTAEITYELFLRALHDADRERVRCALQETVEGKGDLQVDYRAVGVVDRVERWIESRGRVVARDEHGLATRLVGTMLDVTPRKRLEQASDTFVGIVGHDLRSPLNTISMAAHLLRMRGALEPADLGLVKRIIDNAERMARLIADVLDVTISRLSGAMPIRRARLEMSEVVARTIDEVKIARPDRRIVLETSGDTSGDWDRDRIIQLVTNLVENAVAHGKDPVMVRVAGGRDEVSLAVSNRGPTIPPEQLATLFDPFRRGDRARGPGVGLGLFIAAQIVRAHGGTIGVDSEGDVTVFSTTWPRTVGAPRDERAPEEGLRP